MDCMDDMPDDRPFMAVITDMISLNEEMISDVEVVFFV